MQSTRNCGLRKFNATLLSKWKWKSGLEEKGLWSDIIASRYGSWRSLNHESNNNRDSRWWKDLRCICKGKGDGRNWFNENFRWRLRKGSKILFWKDCCMGKNLFKESYPRMYSNYVQKQFKLEQLWSGRTKCGNGN